MLMLAGRAWWGGAWRAGAWRGGLTRYHATRRNLKVCAGHTARVQDLQPPDRSGPYLPDQTLHHRDAADGA